LLPPVGSRPLGSIREDLYFDTPHVRNHPLFITLATSNNRRSIQNIIPYIPFTNFARVAFIDVGFGVQMYSPLATSNQQDGGRFVEGVCAAVVVM
jgi:hypothetical protein